jgi:hypothetical protein
MFCIGTTADLFTHQSSDRQHSDEDDGDIIIVIILNVKVKFSPYCSTTPSMKAYGGMKSGQLLSVLLNTEERDKYSSPCECQNRFRLSL